MMTAKFSLVLDLVLKTWMTPEQWEEYVAYVKGLDATDIDGFLKTVTTEKYDGTTAATVQWLMDDLIMRLDMNTAKRLQDDPHFIPRQKIWVSQAPGFVEAYAELNKVLLNLTPEEHAETNRLVQAAKAADAARSGKATLEISLDDDDAA